MHRFVPDLANSPAAAPTLDSAQLAAVKTIVRDLLRLPAATPVVVSELACADAGCPLLETVVAVFPDSASPRRWRFTRPRAALTRMMLSQTLATPPETPMPVPGFDTPVTLAP